MVIKKELLKKLENYYALWMMIGWEDKVNSEMKLMEALKERLNIIK